MTDVIVKVTDIILYILLKNEIINQVRISPEPKGGYTMKAISRTAAAGAAAMILFTGCTSLPDHTRTKDSTMIMRDYAVKI